MCETWNESEELSTSALTPLPTDSRISRRLYLDPEWRSLQSLSIALDRGVAGRASARLASWLHDPTRDVIGSPAAKGERERMEVLETTPLSPMENGAPLMRPQT